MRLYLSILFLLVSSFAFSQKNQFVFGTAPEIAAGIPINDNTQYSLKIESMHQFYEGAEGEINTWKYKHDETAFQNFIDYRLNPFWKLAVGYQFEIYPRSGPSHRSIEQVFYVQRLRSLRIGHRIRADQTFFQNESAEYRIRYRPSVELPLQGQSIDPEEFYFVASIESIIGTQNGDFSLENRLASSIGYLLANKDKIQIGIDHRTDNWLTSGIRNRLWFRVGWFTSFK